MHPFRIARCNLPSKIMALANKPQSPDPCALCFFGETWKGRGRLNGKERFLTDHDDVNPVIWLQTDSTRCAWLEYEPSEITWPFTLDGNGTAALAIDDNLRRAAADAVPTAHTQRSGPEPVKRVNASSAKGRRHIKAGKGGKQRRRF